MFGALDAGRSWRAGNLVLAAACMLIAPAASQASGPEVQFDLAAVVECRDVTSEQFAVSHSDQKVIEATFPVSVRIRRGEERDLTELSFEILSPQRRLRVAEIEPGKTLESPVDGPVEVRQTTEKLRSLGAGLAGSVPIPLPGADLKLSPSATLGTTSRKQTVETSRRVAASKLVVVSGTLNHRAGVFIKVKPSLHDSLEGMRQFVCRFVVPVQWRADWVVIRCEASGRHTQMFHKSVKSSGRLQLHLGMYLEGDRAAHAAAMQLASAQGLRATRTAEAARSIADASEADSQPASLLPIPASRTATAMLAWLSGDGSRERSTAGESRSDPRPSLDQARLLISGFSGY